MKETPRSSVLFLGFEFARRPLSAEGWTLFAMLTELALYFNAQQ